MCYFNNYIFSVFTEKVKIKIKKAVVVLYGIYLCKLKPY